MQLHEWFLKMKVMNSIPSQQKNGPAHFSVRPWLHHARSEASVSFLVDIAAFILCYQTALLLLQSQQVEGRLVNDQNFWFRSVSSFLTWTKASGASFFQLAPSALGLDDSEMADEFVILPATVMCLVFWYCLTVWCLHKSHKTSRF